jgi:hypothetical protein
LLLNQFHAFVAMDLASTQNTVCSRESSSSSGWRLKWLYKLQCNEVKHVGKVEIIQGMPSLHCFQALVGKRPVNCDEKNISQSKQASYFSQLLGLPEHHGTIRYGMPWSHSGQGSIIIAVQEGKRWDWHLSSPVHSL